MENFLIKSEKLQIFGLLFFVALLNVIFYYTYPINVANFDYAGYLGMMNNQISNLILASGYPAVFILLINGLNISSVSSILDTTWLEKIQLLQLIIHLMLLLISYWFCIKIFNKIIAGVMLVVWGLSTLFMANVNSGAPEWLHGDLIALSLLMSFYAFSIHKIIFKYMFYILSALIFCIAYLVKFNSLVLLPVLIAVVLLDKKEVIWKILIITTSFCFGFILIFCYVKYFHYPSTKTKQLNYDHAWVLIDAIPADYFALPIESMKINSLRWRALSTMVPPDYSVAGAYCCIDIGAAPDVREGYKSKYNQIMRLSESELIDFLRINPLPPGYVKGASAIPLYWNFGLPETDALGIAVYRESLFAIPVSYVKKILNGISNSSAYTKQMVPLYSNSQGVTLGKVPLNENGFIHFKPLNSENLYAQPYYNPSERVWGLGVKIFDILSKILMPRWLELLLISISMFGLILQKNTKFQFFGILCLSSLIIFSTASFMLLGMRTKEFVSITPILAIFYGLGIFSIFDFIRNHLFSKKI